VKIVASRTGGTALLQLEGRLDREGAERLSDALEEHLHDGVRSLCIDFSRVTYASSAATAVLTRCHQELSVLRGDMEIRSLPPGVRELFASAGWNEGLSPAAAPGQIPIDRRSYWHTREDFAASGQYELSSCVPGGALTCRLLGDPARLTGAPLGPDDCGVAAFPRTGFGIGIGAIGSDYRDCRPRLGELIGVTGCVASFPGDGARLPDYLLGGASVTPSALLASGLVCEGAFAQLMRFSPRQEAGAVPLSELASVALDAVGGRAAGLVVVGEAAGLCGAKLRRSPVEHGSPPRFEVPEVREWLSFAPERTHPVTTALIAGVVSAPPQGPVGAHLRPLGPSERLYGHVHAAVFSYRPLPQRTVELDDLVRGLFTDHQLRDVLHLVWDDRPHGAVSETALVRGVGWIAPITRFA
jgi:anti-anti-sigma factor